MHVARAVFPFFIASSLLEGAAGYDKVLMPHLSVAVDSSGSLQTVAADPQRAKLVRAEELLRNEVGSQPEHGVSVIELEDARQDHPPKADARKWNAAGNLARVALVRAAAGAGSMNPCKNALKYEPGVYLLENKGLKCSHMVRNLIDFKPDMHTCSKEWSFGKPPDQMNFPNMFEALLFMAPCCGRSPDVCSDYVTQVCEKPSDFRPTVVVKGTKCLTMATPGLGLSPFTPSLQTCTETVAFGNPLLEEQSFGVNILARFEILYFLAPCCELPVSREPTPDVCSKHVTKLCEDSGKFTPKLDADVNGATCFTTATPGLGLSHFIASTATCEQSVWFGGNYMPRACFTMVLGRRCCKNTADVCALWTGIGTEQKCQV